MDLMAGVNVYVVKWPKLWDLPSRRLELLGQLHSWSASSLYNCTDCI